MERGQTLAVLAGCSHFFLNGLIYGWVSPAVDILKKLEDNPFGDVITNAQTSLLATASYGCGVFTLLFSGPVTNRFGRKPVMVWGAVARFLAHILAMLAVNFPMLVAARMMDGMTAGLTYPVTLVYLGEVTKTHNRGLALTLTGFFHASGQVAMYSIGPFLSIRGQNMFMAVASVVVSLLVVWMPESPEYLLSKGKTDEANKSLKALNRTSEINPQECQKMLPKSEELTISSWKMIKMLLSEKKNLKPFALVCYLNVAQQCCGITAVISFSTMIFQETGSSIPPYISTILVGTTQMISCFTSSMLVERVGRKPLLLASCFMTTGVHFALGMYFYKKSVDQGFDTLTWLPLPCLILFIFFYFNGIGVIPNTLMGELFSLKVKSVASGLVCFIEIFFASAVVFAFPLIGARLGIYNSFFVYAGSCVIMFIVSALLVPETKGKTSREIQELYS